MAPQFGGRFVVAVSASDVGRRVTVRRRDSDGMRDTVGVLESWANGVLRVRRRDGAVVEISEETVVAAKVVPERPPGR
ncbi:hypothetical protein PYR91_31070 [Sphaerisporangium sp. TRM90804]|nr:hypothetical protein [Sphaerisporangium sp. TRM90804]MDH2429888.1 hypothetical protein [Sphaerisporangium sp. TRM90804]